MTEFAPFPKIPRLYRDVVVTEKLDGTNASIYFDESGPDSLLVGSRTRWITPENDNYGFAAWAGPRRESLFALLGHGHHFGEWYGVGINRGYDLHERRLALFNTRRWAGVRCEIAAKGLVDLPNVECAPILYEGAFDQYLIAEVLTKLHVGGSVAVPGYPNPEGIVVYHKAASQLFKFTLDGDAAKGERS